jgi:hypothetical protein
MLANPVPDNLYPLTELPRREWMPRKNGKPINPYTVIRWALKGKAGRRLQTLMVGGIRCCCDPWAMAFFQALTDNNNADTKPLSDTRRLKDHRDAEAELSAAGIG